MTEFRIILFVFLLSAFYGNHGNCQVCIETRSVLREVPETYSYTYMEAYEDESCVFWCTKSRYAVNVATRMIKKHVPEEVMVCCEGYAKDTKNEGPGIHCVPTCTEDCVHGYCKGPNECVCDTGFALDPLNPRICLPLCLQGCEGHCVLPEDWNCHHDPSNNLPFPEKPVCSDPCHNGTCVAPEICQCLPGYARSGNSCEPVCTDCGHGSCAASNTCVCDPGYRAGSDNGCQPICTESCVNAECVAPEVCECLSGYSRSKGVFEGECRPHCSDCLHGECVALDTCVCNHGFTMEMNTCVPVCEPSCGNGSCVSVNECDCFEGYNIDQNKDSQEMCSPVCKGCEGHCVAPEECVCYPPYLVKHVTKYGDDCSCFGVCANELTKCERVICVEPSETANDTVTNNTLFVKRTVIVENDYEFGNKSQAFKEDVVLLSNSQQNVTYHKSDTFNNIWIYGIIVAILLLIAITIFVIKKRRSGNIFLKDKEIGDICFVQYKQ